MKKVLTFGLLFLALTSFFPKKPLKTIEYAGKYSYGYGEGTGEAKNFGGSITIYPETDTTVLFWIDIYDRDLAQKYARLLVKKDTSIFEEKEFGCCKWDVTFEKEKLKISTIDKCYKCGFGGTLFAGHEYKRMDNTIPQFFIDAHGKKIYFKETNPEKYYHTLH